MSHAPQPGSGSVRPARLSATEKDKAPRSDGPTSTKTQAGTTLQRTHQKAPGDDLRRPQSETQSNERSLAFCSRTAVPNKSLSTGSAPAETSSARSRHIAQAARRRNSVQSASSVPPSLTRDTTSPASDAALTQCYHSPHGEPPQASKPGRLKGVNAHLETPKEEGDDDGDGGDDDDGGESHTPIEAFFPQLKEFMNHIHPIAAGLQKHSAGDYATITLPTKTVAAFHRAATLFLDQENLCVRRVEPSETATDVLRTPLLFPQYVEHDTDLDGSLPNHDSISFGHIDADLDPLKLLEQVRDGIEQFRTELGELQLDRDELLNPTEDTAMQDAPLMLQEIDIKRAEQQANLDAALRQEQDLSAKIQELGLSHSSGYSLEHSAAVEDAQTSSTRNAPVEYPDDAPRRIRRYTAEASQQMGASILPALGSPRDLIGVGQIKTMEDVVADTKHLHVVVRRYEEELLEVEEHYVQLRKEQEERNAVGSQLLDVDLHHMNSYWQRRVQIESRLDSVKRQLRRGLY
ncbi:hypothetical protein CLCR_04790 [Cladophialophora carrionii]|uniref:Uncharacterized protein n=1 Tax=Cladophialophora carrionii TaxID=86049 RepID=A0A1C1CKY1_9EURO|nr:hypothetical protein CLCR_04790 [Cladophialophora carrionii]